MFIILFGFETYKVTPEVPTNNVTEYLFPGLLDNQHISLNMNKRNDLQMSLWGNGEWQDGQMDNRCDNIQITLFKDSFLSFFFRLYNQKTQVEFLIVRFYKNSLTIVNVLTDSLIKIWNIFVKTKKWHIPFNRNIRSKRGVWYGRSSYD